MNTVEIKLIGEQDYYVQEAYKVLRTNVRFCGNDIRVISITSCDENEGKTTVSLELGKSLADLESLAWIWTFLCFSTASFLSFQ